MDFFLRYLCRWGLRSCELPAGGSSRNAVTWIRARAGNLARRRLAGGAYHSWNVAVGRVSRSQRARVDNTFQTCCILWNILSEQNGLGRSGYFFVSFLFARIYQIRITVASPLMSYLPAKLQVALQSLASSPASCTNSGNLACSSWVCDSASE